MSKRRDRRLDIRWKELSNGFHGERPHGSGEFALLSSFKEQAFLLLRFIGRLLCLFAFLIILIQLMSYLFNAEWLPLSLMAFLLLIPHASCWSRRNSHAHSGINSPAHNRPRRLDRRQRLVEQVALSW
ncbi:hypothetical protein NKH16_26295 [Mesorhizobium sp. M1307]|uniref:hypothetical protein n=1 Tax=Mesorhizobium sp. M1307 TaxID=2957079 RepID=UPI00333B2028